MQAKNSCSLGSFERLQKNCIIKTLFFKQNDAPMNISKIFSNFFNAKEREVPESSEIGADINAIDNLWAEMIEIYISKQ